MQEVTLKRLDGERSGQWDRYVDAHPEATPYHSRRWLDFLTAAAGYRCDSRLIYRDGALVGVLPLLRKRNLLVDRLASLPLSMYGGPLVDGPATFAAALAALQAEITGDGPALEIRTPLEVEPGGLHRWVDQIDYFIDLAGQNSADRYLREQNQGAVLRAVRKSVKEGVTCEYSAAGIDEFYDQLSRHRQRLHLPIASRRYYHGLADAMHGSCGLLLCRQQGQPVGSVLFLRSADALYYAVPAFTTRSQALRVPDRVLWELMALALEQGHGRVYLGGHAMALDGLTRFKRKWSNRQRPIYAYASKPAGQGGRPGGHPLFRWLPQPLAGMVGDRLVKWMG